MVEARNLTEKLRFHGRYGSETQQECAERKNIEREQAADRLEALERQIAELRAKVDVQRQSKEYAQRCCESAEAENARLRALPLKDEVERVLEPFAALGEWEHLPGTDMPDEFEPCLTRHYKTVPITIGHLRAARALLSRLRAGEQEGWKSMDSAPMDGRFLAYEKGRYFDCWWCDKGYGEAYWMDEADSEPAPTHWQPLPAAPSEQGGDRG